MRHGASAGASASSDSQGGLGRLAVAALQRGFCAVEAGARVIAGLGKLGLGLGCDIAPCREHEEFSELSMEARLVRCQGDRPVVSRAGFGEALERGKGATEQDPAFDMTGILLQSRLELFGCGSEFGSVVRAGGCGDASWHVRSLPAHRPRSR